MQTDGKGSYADLNKDAGTGHIAKEGPNQKIVYLGYKTTDDASDAITDLAVMNMHGGYDFEDYNKLMDKQMDTQIKPFVDRFVATLNEYRANLNKPKDSVNYKRANYYKTLLNKLTDDDTGNKPLGDLLVNQTKYEMGDDAYNKLSDTEKKSRCDILTLLMQGNGQLVQLMETELTKGSDSANTTWLNRFLKTDLDRLTEAVKKEHPDMTPSEINAELDKKYNDDARKIRDKWGYFNEVLINYDTAVKKAEEVVNSDAGKNEIEINENSTDQEVKDATVEMYKAEADMVKRSHEHIRDHLLFRKQRLSKDHEADQCEIQSSSELVRDRGRQGGIQCDRQNQRCRTGSGTAGASRFLYPQMDRHQRRRQHESG